MEESIDSLMNEIRARLDLLEQNLPRRVDPIAVSRTAKLPFKALSHREALAWRMAELGRSAFESFQNEKLTSAIMLTRAAVETSAVLWYLCAKVDSAVEAGSVGDIDNYLMRLIVGSRTDPDMPQAINVLKFVDCVDKDIDGFRHQYDVLSEFAHPNWAGTTSLYSNVDLENLWIDFGSNPGDDHGPKHVGVINLSVALEMFEHSYNRLGDLIPPFIILCEGHLKTDEEGGNTQ